MPALKDKNGGSSLDTAIVFEILEIKNHKSTKLKLKFLATQLELSDHFYHNHKVGSLLNDFGTELHITSVKIIK